MNEITLQQLAQQMSGMPDVHNPDWATACSKANQVLPGDLPRGLQRDALSFPAQRTCFGLFGFSPSFAAPSA